MPIRYLPHTRFARANRKSGGGETIPTENLLRWFKADSGVTETGTGVSEWVDNSDNGENATQGTDSARPTLTPNEINSLPSIIANGSSDYLSFTAMGLFTNITIFMVVKPLGGNEIVMGSSTVANNYIQLLGNSSVRFAVGSYVDFATGSPATGYHIIELKRDYQGAFPMYGFIDGVASSSNPQNFGGNFSTIDQLFRYGTGAAYGKAPLAELLIYSDYKSADDSLTITNYLKNKYGI